MSSRLMRVAEASRLLHASKSRVYELAREGILPPGVVVRLGRQVRISEAKLREWIESGGQCLPGGWKRRPPAS